MGSRLFNEKQVREILTRASASQSADADGISLEELQRVAAELGLDPHEIQRAAEGVGNESRSPMRILDGRVYLDQTVEGEASPEVWQGMVALVQRHYKKPGTVSQRGSNYDWVASEEGGSLTLSLTAKNGKSRIRLESSSWMGLFFVAVFCPVLTLAFSLSAIKHGYASLAIGLCLFGAALMFTLVRSFRSNHVQSVRGLMDRLVAEVESGDLAQSLGSASGLSARTTSDTEIATGQHVVSNSQ